MPIIQTDDQEIKSMTGLHIYHAGISNCSMRVRIMAEEKNIPWKSHKVNLSKKENLEDWYLKINPKGLVPAIVYDGEIVTESNDILLYLEEKFPEPALIPNNNETLAEEVKYWVNLCSEIHVATIKTFVYGTLGGGTKAEGDMERYRQIQPDKTLLAFHEQSLKGFPEGQVKQAAEQIHKIFSQLDKKLADNEWIVGEQLTLADIAWIPQYVLLGGLGFPVDHYRHLTRWAKAFEQRDSYKKGIKKWMPPVPLSFLRLILKIKRMFSN
jgi:glutathione S-transferase